MTPNAQAHTAQIHITSPDVRRIIALMEAAESAHLWLCECRPGSDPKERGDALKAALAEFITPEIQDKGGMRFLHRTVSAHETLVALVAAFAAEDSQCDVEGFRKLKKQAREQLAALALAQADGTEGGR